MNDELNDELPSPPTTVRDISTVDDSFEASSLSEVPKLGEALPVGTYAFRLDSFTEEWSTKEYLKGGGERDLLPEEKQPYFKLIWKCQQEPFTGRVVFENIPWVKGSDSRDANDNNSPRKGEARKIVNKRMPRAKDLMEASGFTPSGQSRFKDFLNSHPEVGLQVKLKARKAKVNGELKPTGDWDNEVVRHVSLHRPR